jgi:hypothetical protein
MRQKLTHIVAAIGVCAALAGGLTLAGGGIASAAQVTPSAGPSGVAPTVVCRMVRVCDQYGCHYVRRCWR